MESGRNLVDKAEQNLESAKETAENIPLSSSSKVISDAQKAIEQASKALFLLMDVPFPERHGFDISEQGQAADLVKKAKHNDFPDDFVDEKSAESCFVRTFGLLHTNPRSTINAWLDDDVPPLLVMQWSGHDD